MITSLSIENYALIEKLNIQFSAGFSTITGETGAGKSILLGALGLVLGKRADLTSLKNKSEKCIIEAQFDIHNYNLESFFEANDLDYEKRTVIRREILPSGKSRAFVNDTPTNLNELQQLGTYLLDIHSQHETQELSDEVVQFQIIDAVGGNFDLLDQYSTQLREHKKLDALINHKIAALQKSQNEQEYDTYLLNELLQSNLKLGEQEVLEADFEKLNNVEFIKEHLSKALSIANDDQFGILSNLKELKGSFQKIALFSENYKTLNERISSVSIEFDDVIKEVTQLSETVFSDPENLEAINQKLQLIYMLQKKHQVNSVAELLFIQNNLDTKVVSLSDLKTEIDRLTLDVAKSTTILNELAQLIENNRLRAIPVLTEKLTTILSPLGIPNARFDMQLTTVANFLPNGKNKLQFLFSANKGTDFGLLKKVASGGEMSRIMLAVKSILAGYSKLPTLIFDEIDTGVSGEVANKMAEVMFDMSSTMQIFAITHLPQIASKGSIQYKVFKTIQNNVTKTQINQLSTNERIVEIAQMLSGTTITDTATNHAKQLLAL